jgi:hypothetical protein
MKILITARIPATVKRRDGKLDFTTVMMLVAAAIGHSARTLLPDL